MRTKGLSSKRKIVETEFTYWTETQREERKRVSSSTRSRWIRCRVVSRQSGRELCCNSPHGREVLLKRGLKQGAQPSVPCSRLKSDEHLPSSVIALEPSTGRRHFTDTKLFLETLRVPYMMEKLKFLPTTPTPQLLFGRSRVSCWEQVEQIRKPPNVPQNYIKSAVATRNQKPLMTASPLSNCTRSNDSWVCTQPRARLWGR